MEHVVQFGINIDDNCIEQAVVKETTKQICDTLKEQIFVKEYYSGKHHGLSRAAIAIVEEWCDKHKDEIIDKVVDELVSILKNRKAFRDKIKDADIL